MLLNCFQNVAREGKIFSNDQKTHGGIAQKKEEEARLGVERNLAKLPGLTDSDCDSDCDFAF